MLKEFGNLKIGHDAQGVECETTMLEIDPFWGEGDLNNFTTTAKSYGVKALYPLGYIPLFSCDLAIDPRGRIFAFAIVGFLARKWAKELDYRLIKELWAFTGDRIAERFQYEYHDILGAWFRAHGNEQWEFEANGLMRRREASINDVPILEEDRKFRWPMGPRPADYPGLTDLGL